MNRFVSVSLFLATLGLASLVPADARAHGLLGRCCGGHSCAPAECTVVECAPAAPVYEERKVTAYRSVIKEKDVTVVVCRSVPREEKFEYTVCVPSYKDEKRSYTVHVPHQKEVDYKYTVMVPFTVKEKRTIVECTPTYRDEEYTYTVCVPVTTKKTVKQTYYTHQTRMVEQDVTRCRMVRECVVDDCGRCCTVCRPVTEVVKVQRCVVDCVPAVRDVEVCEVSYTHEPRKGVRRVCEVKRQERVIDVDVVQCRPEERVGKRVVCEYLPEVRECTVRVCSYVHEKRVGTRTVCELVKENQVRKVQYCEMEPYETTVRVLVGGCEPSYCGHGHRCFGGLFRRCGGHGCH